MSDERKSWVNASVDDVCEYLFHHRPPAVAPELVAFAYATTFVAGHAPYANHKCIVFFRPADLCGVATATVLACAVVPTTESGEFQVLWNDAAAE